MKSICFVALIALLVSGCGGSDSIPTAPSANVPFSTIDLVTGTGTEATVGRNVTVNFSGWVWDSLGPNNKGSRFDAGTFPFTVGASNIIPGFSQGVTGMRVGGLRRVVMPPSVAYGNNPPPGSGIRANETLIFEIELVSVQ
jgi:FKBP-type peptidyl-prolyl cis-trans isomerase FkpA